MHIIRNIRRVWLLLCVLVVSCSVMAQVNPINEMGITFEGNGMVRDTFLINKNIQAGKDILDVDPDSAIVIFKKALRDSRSMGYANGISWSLLSIGKVYTIKAKYDEAKQIWLEGLKNVYLSGADPKLLSGFYSSLGVLYGIKGSYTESLNTLYTSLALAQSVPFNDYGIGTAYNNLATVFMRMPNTPPEKPLYYLENAAKHAKLAKDDRLLAGVLNNEGALYIHQKKWDKSRMYFDSALALATRQNYIESQYSILLSIGELYLSNNRTDLALEYLKRAQQLDQRGVNPYYINLTNLRIGEAYAQMNQFDKAKEYVLKAESNKQMLGITSYRYQIYESLSRLYRLTGNYKKSLEYYRLYNMINDSILKQNTLNYISEMDIKYKSIQKEKEIAKSRLIIFHQQDRLTRNNVFIFLGFACTVLLAIVLLITIKSSQQKQKIVLKERSIDNLKSMIEGEEKERMRLAKELHDGIGGMLAAIKFNFGSLTKGLTEAENEKLREIKSMLEDTSNEVRAVAYDLVPDPLIKYGLQKALQTYCSGLSGPGLEINLQFYGNIDLIEKSDELTLYRIVQELIQNVIKHASASVIEIQLMEYDKHINLTFEDNGTGFDVNKMKAGLGLQNIKTRVASLQGSLSIVPVNNRGTSIHIEFALDKKK